MNFSEGFCKWVRLLYTDVNCIVTNNGHASKPMKLTRGARQDYPLSLFLYILVAETPANLTRQNPGIDGLFLPGSKDQVKISQYADDATLLLLGEYSVHKAFEIIEIHEKDSGSKLNMHKTKGMWLISKAGQGTGPVDIEWINDKLKLLAITFSSDSAILTSWRERVSKLEKCLNVWQHRELSLQGKVLILNTPGLSSLVYLGSVQPIPITCLQSINTLIFKCLWSGKTVAINRATLFLSKDRGGLGITDLEIKLPARQLKWLKSTTSP